MSLRSLALALLTFAAVACSDAKGSPMPESHVALAPLVYPTFTRPVDSDSPLASGQLRTSLKQVMDALDYVKGTPINGAIVSMAANYGALPRTADTASTVTYEEANAGDGTITFTGLKVGQRVMVDAVINHRTTVGLTESQVSVRLQQVGGSASVQTCPYASISAATSDAEGSLAWFFTVPEDGDYKAMIVHRVSTVAGGPASTINQMHIRAAVFASPP